MNKILFLLCLSVLAISCKLFSTKKSKATINPKPKYSFQIMSMPVYLQCFGPTRIFGSGVWYDEFFNGICRQDSIVIPYTYNNKLCYDTIARPIVNNTNYIPNNNVRLSDWQNEKVNIELLNNCKVLLNDSLLFKGLLEGKPFYDTIHKNKRRK